MLRKLTVLLMAALFSVSVAGLGYAQTKPGDKPADKPAAKPADKPAATPAVKPGDKPAVNPCEMSKKPKKMTKAQKVAEQKAACLKKATTDQAKAECEKKFAEKAKKPKKDEKATTMAPAKPVAPAAKPAAPAEKK